MSAIESAGRMKRGERTEHAGTGDDGEHEPGEDEALVLELVRAVRREEDDDELKHAERKVE